MPAPHTSRGRGTRFLPAKGAFCNIFDYFSSKKLDNIRLSDMINI